MLPRPGTFDEQIELREDYPRMNVFNGLLLSIIQVIYKIIPDYGWSIIVFTLLVKLCLTPLDLKSRRSMKRMSDLNPKLEALKKKYGADQEKYNQKMQELYAKEKINPLSGCLPMLISMPILFAMFYAMRTIANEELVRQFLTFQANPAMDVSALAQPFLWIKNLWMPDTPFATVLPDMTSLQGVALETWNAVSQRLFTQGVIPEALNLANKEALDTFMKTVVAPFIASADYAPHVAALSPSLANLNFILFRLTVFKDFNGLFILPALAIVSQIGMTKITGQQNAQPAAQGQPNMNMMTWMFAIMSLIFCTTSSAAFALYWVFSNVFAMVQQIAFAKYFEWQDRKAAIAEEVGIK